MSTCYRNSAVKWLIRLAILQGAGLGLAALADPPAVELSATMNVQERVYEQRQGSLDCVKTNPYSFSLRCIVSKTQWFMESRYFKNSVHFYYFDGTNVYDTFQYTRDDDQTRNNSLTGKKPVATGIVTGRAPGLPHYLTVIPSAHPLSYLGINVPWMAFCSSVYLHQPNRLIPLPGPDQIRHSAYAFGFTDRTERFDDALGLPRSIELYASAALMKKSPHRTLLIRNERMNSIRLAFSTPVPAKDGALHCRYSVESWTNVDGWHIPLEFSLVVQPDRQMDRLVGFEAHGVSQRISPAPSVPEFALKPGTNQITDLRVRERSRFVDAVSYFVTNESTVPPTTDPRVIAALRLAAAKAPVDPAAGMRPRMILFYALVGMFVLFPIAVLLRNHKSRAQTKTTGQE